jgi:cytochrome c oxidase cbb3-type subunit 3
MKKFFPAWVRVPLIFFSVFAAMEYFTDSGDRPAFIKFPMISVFLFVFLFLLIAIEVVVSAVDNVMYQLLSDEQKKQLAEVSSIDISLTDSPTYKK